MKKFKVGDLVKCDKLDIKGKIVKLSNLKNNPTYRVKIDKGAYIWCYWDELELINE